jgi:hypothetical protein
VQGTAYGGQVQGTAYGGQVQGTAYGGQVQGTACGGQVQGTAYGGQVLAEGLAVDKVAQEWRVLYQQKRTGRSERSLRCIPGMEHHHRHACVNVFQHASYCHTLVHVESRQIGVSTHTLDYV